MFFLPAKKIKAQVRYMLIAQLFITKGNESRNMVGGLPELGMSEVRHEVNIYVNVSSVMPEPGLPVDNFHMFEKTVSGMMGSNKRTNMTRISLSREAYSAGERLLVHL